MLIDSEKEDDYYCLVICQCGRKFKPEELYYCSDCMKVKCKYCTIFEGQDLRCKSGCGFTISKNNSFFCNSCLECPLCFSKLIIKIIGQKYALSCSCCHWNSYKILAEEKKEDLNSTLNKMNKEVENGSLKHLYNTILDKLTKEPIFIEKQPIIKTEGEINDSDNKDNENNINLIKGETQDIEKYEKKFDDEIEEMENRETGKLNYVEDYLMREIRKMNLDFENKYNSLEELNLSSNRDFNFRYISGLKQRHNKPSMQSRNKLNLIPKFIDIIPSQSNLNRKCKFCENIIVEGLKGKESGKENELRKISTFIRYFPIVLINKIDLENNVLKLKFIMINKDYPKLDKLNISFKESTKNTVKIILPEGKSKLQVEKNKNKYAFKLLDFQFYDIYKEQLKKDTIHYFNFINIIEVEGEEKEKVEYPVEIKFKIN